jgi:hypothetical protein
MHDGESMPVKYPRNAIEAVQSVVLPGRMPPNAVLGLVISLDSSGVKARDLASYLSLIDHVYGRLDPKGLLSYAHRKEGHLEFSELRAGSVELVISEALEHGWPLVFVFLVLKYLPGFMRGLVGTWKDFEEARFTRFRRKELRDRIRQDDELASISKNHREQIVELLDRTYTYERDSLPGAQRLSREKVRAIRLHVLSRDTDDRGDKRSEE